MSSNRFTHSSNQKWCTTTSFWIPQWMHNWFPVHSACFCCILAHLKTVCALKMAVNHFIQWHYEVRDCLRQIGVSRSYVHLAVWQMRQRLMTWGPCRVKESLRHANKSLLFPLEMRCVSEKTIIEFHSDTCFKDTLYTSIYCNSLSTHLSATMPSVCLCKPLIAVLKHSYTFDSYSKFVFSQTSIL